LLLLPEIRRMNRAIYISGNRWWLHFSFSAAVLALLLLGMYLLHVSGFRFSSTASAVTDCFFFMLCVYAGRWLCQVYFKHGLLVSLLVLLLAITVLSAGKFVLVKYIFNHPGAGFIEVVRDAMPFFLIGVVMGILLKFVRTSVQKELREAQGRAEQKSMEFNLLQSQLSPHFLFNVLNNLYGISLDEQERIPALLLKLSGLLRYSVYGAKKAWVPLQEELDYIRLYIDFEKIRVSDRLVITTDIEPVIDKRVIIAPLLLIVFVENAFKHAKNSLGDKIYIRIALKIAGNFLLFEVTNSYRKENKSNTEDENSGLGLANTLKRLELLYGKDYTLEQYAGNDEYIVQLKLKKYMA